MKGTYETEPQPDGLNDQSSVPEERTRVLHSNGSNELKEKNLRRIAKKINMREKIIVDVIDDDITRVDTVSPEEMEAYNKEYEHFMSDARASMPVYPGEKVMVANLEDYLRYSQDGHPAMVYYSDDMKIPLITLEGGSDMRPHSDSTGIYYVLAGKGTISVGMKSFAVRPGSLIHVPRGVIRSIECEDPMKIMAIHLSK
jgi:quercetin dioxygenase-like cupin family protein